MSKHQEFIDAYAQEIGPTPTPEQTLLLAYFREAGDELPIDGGKAWFHQAWRKTDVIYQRGMGSKDVIVWNLLHIDRTIDNVINRLIEGD
ncbi:hypothetical protein J8631_09740 [Serratia fonticola]|uniref:DUF7238 family protein n=1 Tax=Serratia fonticola TaxID=47917 RepID=UPI001AE46E7F|nr:hypothetical protein [Serratia fonticola]